MKIKTLTICFGVLLFAAGLFIGACQRKTQDVQTPAADNLTPDTTTQAPAEPAQ